MSRRGRLLAEGERSGVVGTDRRTMEVASDFVVCIRSPHDGHFTRSLGAPYPKNCPTRTDFSTSKAGHFGFAHLARMFTREYCHRTSIKEHLLLYLTSGPKRSHFPLLRRTRLVICINDASSIEMLWSEVACLPSRSILSSSSRNASLARGSSGGRLAPARHSGRICLSQRRVTR